MFQKAITERRKKENQEFLEKKKEANVNKKEAMKKKAENRTEMMMMKVQVEAENCERFLTFFNAIHSA